MSMSNIEIQVNDIRCNTQREFSPEEKYRILLNGLQGGYSIAELYQRVRSIRIKQSDSNC